MKKNQQPLSPGPLRVGVFRRYFLGTAISLTGGAMGSVALAFAVLEIAEGVVDLGLVLTSRSLPAILFVLIGGTFADRFRRSTILWTCNIGAAVTQGAVALLFLTGAYNLMAVMVLGFINGALVSFSGPAMRGIIPQLVEEGQLQRANSLLAFWKNGTKVFGPAIAGLLTATAGGAWAIAFDALTFAVAAVFLASLQLPQEVNAKRSRFFGQLREGWSYFRSISWAWIIVLSLSVTNLLFVGIWNVLGPIIANQTFGAAVWGIALGARAVGVIFSSAVMYRVRTRHLLAFGQMGIALGALPLFALGLFPSPYAVIATAFVAGFGSGLFGPAWETSVQEHVPNHVLSRVSSYDDLGSYIGVPIGQVLAAPLALVFGFSVVATGGGAIWLIAALLPLTAPAVRGLKHGPTETSTTATQPPARIG